MTHRWKPSVTVAAIIEREGRYLLIEEHTPEGLRLNNPAGHLELGESLVQACAREALEETAHDFTPDCLVGVYLARFQRPGSSDPAERDITYLRFAFGGTLGQHHAGKMLDSGIERALWLSPQEIRDSVARHRSPMVLQCVEDHLRGQRHPLALLYAHESLLGPTGAG
jgi:8-oxo-dGTP pyrophosphatase MutT (NUDIX family)